MAGARPDRRPMYMYNMSIIMYMYMYAQPQIPAQGLFLEIHAQPVGVNGVATGHASNLMSKSFTLFRQG